MSVWGDGSTEHKSIKIIMSDSTRMATLQRNLFEEEYPQFIIYNAENSNEKMYSKEDGRFLAKGVIGQMLVHVEYSIIEEADEKVYNVIAVYGCRTQIKE